MKKIFLFFMIFGTAQLCAAQEINAPGTSNTVGDAFATFAALVAVIPVVTEALKRLLFPSGKGLGVQLLSWGTGIVLTVAGWALDLGFLSGLSIWLTLLYGAGASLAANGVFDAGIVTALFDLIKPKK
jgi:hypothetical protein